MKAGCRREDLVLHGPGEAPSPSFPDFPLAEGRSEPSVRLSATWPADLYFLVCCVGAAETFGLFPPLRDVTPAPCLPSQAHLVLHF